MHSRAPVSILPTNWILLILVLLCTSLFWRPEPVSLDALSSVSSKTQHLQTVDGWQTMPALLSEKWCAPQRLESFSPVFSFCVHKVALQPLPQAPLRAGYSAAPAPLPKAWDGYSHPSRSPPALG